MAHTAIGTAAHLFKQSEKTGELISELLRETGVPSYPIAEIKKLTATMTEAEITEIVQRLDRSSQHYNAQALDAKKNPDSHNFSEHDYLTMCRDIANRAALWSIA